MPQLEVSATAGDAKNAISAFLDDLRAKSEKSWTQIAGESGVLLSLISRIRGGSRAVTKETASKLAKELLGDAADAADFYMAYAAYLEASTSVRSRPVTDGSSIGLDYIEELRLQVETLESGDSYWLLTTERPIEFDYTSLEEAVVHAAQRGARIYYVFPRLDLQGSTSSTMPIATRQFFAMEAPNRPFFEIWKSELARKYTSNDLSTTWGDRICAVDAPVEKCRLFFSPATKYVLIQRAGGPEHTEGWIEIRYKIDISVPRRYLRLEESVTRILETWCTELIESNTE